MDVEKARVNGALAGMFMMIAAIGINWLITPTAHPDATRAQHVGVFAQVLIAAGLTLWFWRRAGQVASGSSNKRPARSA